MINFKCVQANQCILLSLVIIIVLHLIKAIVSAHFSRFISLLWNEEIKREIKWLKSRLFC